MISVLTTFNSFNLLIMKMYKNFIYAAFLAAIFGAQIVLTGCAGRSQQDDMMVAWQEMNAAKQEHLEWFQDARFGMFIHWGIYSIPAGIWNGKKMEEMGRPWISEWIQYVAQIPRAEYALLANEFNPVYFDADAIARLARDAGMRYLVITTKHHDGFAMYHSEASPFNIVDATPFGRDVIEELYHACKRHGIAFGVYYSHNIDWADSGDSQYSVIKAINDAKGIETHFHGPNTWDPSPDTFEEYLENKAYPQVRELMTRFPDMRFLWYDMSWYLFPEQSLEFYRLATSIQPHILVNSRVGHGFGDFDVSGDNHIPEDPDQLTKPWEVVGTLNNSWGYKSYDNDWKSPEELLFWLVEIVSKGGNFMLNIGPDALGRVPEQSVKHLRIVGDWLSVNGDAIYGTSRWRVHHEGPTRVLVESTHARQVEGFTAHFTPEDFWFTTKDNTLYAIAFAVAENREAVIASIRPGDGTEIERIGLLGLDDSLEWELRESGLHVALPETLPSELGYVISIAMK